jgi:hypothetical protein
MVRNWASDATSMKFGTTGMIMEDDATKADKVKKPSCGGQSMKTRS